MQANFWHEKWQANQIGFHRETPNPLLVDHLNALSLAQGARVFVPLCGKTRDIAWLMSQGHRVAGGELSEIAIQQLFEELGIAPQVSSVGALKLYTADGIDIFVGDIFDLTAEVLGQVDAVFDRAALVALPLEMRLRYSAHLARITQNAPQLLITFAYDQAVMSGPPFSVTGSEVSEHYGGTYDIEKLDSVEVEGGLKGMCPAMADVWALRVI